MPRAHLRFAAIRAPRACNPATLHRALNGATNDLKDLKTLSKTHGDPPDRAAPHFEPRPARTSNCVRNLRIARSHGSIARDSHGALEPPDLEPVLIKYRIKLEKNINIARSWQFPYVNEYNITILVSDVNPSMHHADVSHQISHRQI